MYTKKPSEKLPFSDGLSEQCDLNTRPLAPHASTLANCAMPRFQ